jgi:hypothetical protein
MGGIKMLHKTERNEFGGGGRGYSYVSADAFYAALGPLMSEAGLITILQQADWHTRTIETTKGPRIILFIDWDIYLCHSSGVMWTYPLRRSVNVDSGGAQVWGGAQTYVEKYFLRSLLKIPTGEKNKEAAGDYGDTDADADPAYQEVPKKRKRIPIPGYDPTPPEARRSAESLPPTGSGDKHDARRSAEVAETQEISAATDGAGNPPQQVNPAEIVNAFSAALIHEDTPAGLKALLEQFRDGAGRNLPRKEVERAVNNYNQVLEKLEADRYGRQ